MLYIHRGGGGGIKNGTLTQNAMVQRFVISNTIYGCNVYVYIYKCCVNHVIVTPAENNVLI